jgi:hypothetical protein
MKKIINIILIIMMVMAFASCKKTQYITMAELVGKWNEAQPCTTPNGCYNFQFYADSTCIRTSPSPDTLLYYLNNSSIQFYRQGQPVSSENLLPVVVNSSNNITFKNFISNCYSCPYTNYDLNLQKQ